MSSRRSPSNAGVGGGPERRDETTVRLGGDRPLALAVETGLDVDRYAYVRGTDLQQLRELRAKAPGNARREMPPTVPDGPGSGWSADGRHGVVVSDEMGV
jgi:hypothetical protein